ncbi:hypothetical protein HZA42_05500 [Candidatus Peregrinibacteria bacterium]|nr:hypothetical protein [Candidatus Peregrinibacteria bacterium]
MKQIQKFLVNFLLMAVFAVGMGLPYQIANAQILPSPAKDFDCSDKYKEKKELYKALNTEEGFDTFIKSNNELGNALGCAVKLGRIRLYMMPFFIMYLTKFLLGIAGLISVIFIILGGYNYATGGLTEDKEGGKKYIKNALIGLIVSLSAWIVVSLVQAVLTS